VSERTDLPPEWMRTNLKTIAEIVTGTTPSKVDLDNYGDVIPFVKAGDLHGRGLVRAASEYLSARGARASRVLPAGSVMVACIGSLGKVGLSATRVVTNQQINSLVLLDELEPEFVYYYCTSSDFQQLMESHASGYHPTKAWRRVDNDRNGSHAAC